MSFNIWYLVFGIAAVPFIAHASYGPPLPSQIAYLPSASSSAGLEEYVNVATGGNINAAQSITAAAEIQPSPAEAGRLSQVQAQIQALNNNPTYQNLKNSDAIAESIAESNLASNIRQGKISVVAPNVVDQSLFRSLLVPSGNNNHQVVATQPLPPIVVNQPGSPPQQVSSGPPAVVKAAPVIYKIKPSVIFQQEVINRVPTPLSLNPVYVKVYKPGKKIDAPVSPVVSPVYNQAAYAAAPAATSAASDSYATGNVAPLYAQPAQYQAAPAQYASQPQYAPQPAYPPPAY